MSELETRHYIPAELELRQGGRSIRGTFPYESIAVVSDRLSERKETFSAGAFQFSLAEAKAKRARIDVLDGHSFDKPLGNSLDDTATFTEVLGQERGVEALVFEVQLPLENLRPTYMVDLTKKIDAGLARGVSPGFRVPPADVVPNAVQLIPERGNPSVMIRRINQAVLFELSIVTRAAYPDTEVERRMAEIGMSFPAQPTITVRKNRRIWL